MNKPTIYPEDHYIRVGQPSVTIAKQKKKKNKGWNINQRFVDKVRDESEAQQDANLPHPMNAPIWK